MATLWAQVLALLDGHHLEAVGSRAPDRVPRLAATFSARQAELAELGQLAEIVVVASAPPNHASDVLAAIRAGAAAVVETPLCTTLADADALVAAVAVGARVAYGENLLFAPLVREALHLAADLGPLRYLEARVAQKPSRRWSNQNASWGGGALFDVGSHPLAIMLTLAQQDQPVAVQARFERRVSSAPDAVEDLAEVQLQFASGARGYLMVSTTAEDPQWDLQVATEDSTLRLELLPHPHLELHGVDRPSRPRRFEGIEPSQLETFGYLDQAWENGRDLLLHPGPAWLGATFGRYVLDVVCAAYRSAGSGHPETLPFSGPRHLTPWQQWQQQD